jgi:hypothetical protein
MTKIAKNVQQYCKAWPYSSIIRDISSIKAVLKKWGKKEEGTI